MEDSKLRQLIDDENERLEEEALRDARNIIQSIVKEQQKIRDAQSAIVEYRKELKDLGVEVVDPTAVLGNE